MKCSTNDLRDFYYYFEVSERRARRNILCGPVKTSDVRELQCFDASLEQHSNLFGALNTLAMGDLQAVAIAQTCHLGMAVQNNIFCENELLTGKGPIPRGPDYFEVVIDDFVGISDVPRESREQSRAALKADSIEGVYRQVGLQPHEEKAERDVLTGTFWGVHLDGAL